MNVDAITKIKLCKTNNLNYVWKPAGEFPALLGQFPDILQKDKGRSQTGPGVILLHQVVHLPLPHLHVQSVTEYCVVRLSCTQYVAL